MHKVYNNITVQNRLNIEICASLKLHRNFEFFYTPVIVLFPDQLLHHRYSFFIGHPAQGQVPKASHS